jgi:hypothetical protein
MVMDSQRMLRHNALIRVTSYQRRKVSSFPPKVEAVSLVELHVGFQITSKGKEILFKTAKLNAV